MWVVRKLGGLRDGQIGWGMGKLDEGWVSGSWFGQIGLEMDELAKG